MNLKLYFPEAQNIICAFNLPGSLKHYTQDYCDDKENYAGSKLLHMLKMNNVTSRVVFVVRYSNGTKLGPKRFEYILKAAKQAIEVSPFNKFVNEKQVITDIFPKVSRSQQPYRADKPTRLTADGLRPNARGGSHMKRVYHPSITPRQPSEQDDHDEDSQHDNSTTDYEARAGSLKPGTAWNTVVKEGRPRSSQVNSEL